MTDLDNAIPPDVGLVLVKPPLWLLGLGAACALASFVLLASGQHWAHWAGYGLGTAGTILFIALFRMQDAARTVDPRYSRIPWAGFAAASLLVIGVVGGCANIYYLAQRIG